MLFIFLLGFTHFLGGPYFFFRFIFWVALLPFFISIFVLFLLLFKTRKFFKKNIQSQNQETIHIEAEIKEE